MTDYTNQDGLTRHYGPQVKEDTKYQVVSLGGGIKQLVIDFTHDDLPGFDADAGSGSTPDSFSGAMPFIPAGSTIYDAVFIVQEIFDNGTSYTVGTHEQDGTAIDADGIFTGTALAEANLTAGAVLTADGVDVVKTSGTFDGAVVSTTDNAYVRVAASGSFTSGKGRLLITYIEGVEA